MLSAFGAGGTELPWIPLLAVQAWRGVFFVAALALIGRYWFDLRRHDLPTFSRWGSAAFCVFIVQALIRQAERWDAPLRLEGLPLQTVALALCWVAAVQRGRFQRQSYCPGGGTRSVSGSTILTRTGPDISR